MTTKPKLAVAQARPEGPHFTIAATVTRREEFSVPLGPHGQYASVGQFLDHYFGDIAKEGGQIADFSLEIDPEVFAEMYGRGDISQADRELERI